MILHIISDNNCNDSSSFKLAYRSIMNVNSNNINSNSAANNNYSKSSLTQALLLLGEASYHLLNKELIHINFAKLIENNIKIFALSEDCLARGINNHSINQYIELITYEQFVDLVKLYPKNVSW